MDDTPVITMDATTVRRFRAGFRHRGDDGRVRDLIFRRIEQPATRPHTTPHAAG